MVIHEFPTIAIDDFRRKADRPPAELCFLTHMHEDHTAGLARKSYYGPVVYCTATTKALLLNHRTRSGLGELKYEHLRQEVCGKEIVKALELDKPYEFELLSGTSLQVTLLDANHCPGNAMILIQPKAGEGDSVLFTGDFKCEKVHLDTLSRSPSLRPFMRGHGQRSLSIYADDTFLAHTDPFKAYVDNRVGLNDLVGLLISYPRRVHFCIGDRVTGHEEILIALAETLSTKIHMDPYYYDLYKLIASESALARKLVGYCTTTLSDTETRLHFCQKNMACLYREPNAPMAYFKPCNQPTQKMVDLQNAQHAAAAVPPGIMELFEESNSVYQGPDQRYYFDDETKTFFPLFPWFYFSRHASYHEVCGLRDLLNTRAVRSLAGELIPCLAPAAALTSKLGETTSGTLEAATTKRVRSLEGGLVQNDEDLPIVAKKSRMLPFHERVRLQQRKERARKRLEQDTEVGSSLTDSEDEDDRHNAMMLLGQWTGKPDLDGRQAPQKPREDAADGSTVDILAEDEHTKASAVVEEHSTVDESTCSDLVTEAGQVAQQPLENRSLLSGTTRRTSSRRNTHHTSIRSSVSASVHTSVHAPIHAPIRASTRASERASIRGSEYRADLSRALAASRTSCSRDSSSLDNDYVDETIDDLEEADLASLVAQLRENPSHWFDFKFDFVKS